MLGLSMELFEGYFEIEVMRGAVLNRCSHVDYPL